DVVHIPGVDQTADIFTKPLPSTMFLEFRSKINVAALALALHPP
ncbi:hypothetical protein A2U01_0011471, partial [Trifolium medium]|nr:hypothetical protein [Trifolium medium]